MTVVFTLACGTPTAQRPLSSEDASAKLVRSPDGIAGRYIVVLASGAGAHVPTEAAALARAYGGTLAGVMDQLGMFVIEIDDARASALAGDARVTNVSQDRTVSIHAE